MSPAFRGIELSCGGWFACLRTVDRLVSQGRGLKSLSTAEGYPLPPAQFPFKPFSTVIFQNRNIIFCLVSPLKLYLETAVQGKKKALQTDAVYY